MGDQSLARLIRKRREALGFSQARLGELVGRSASTIRNWERGKSSPSSREDAVALAAILGLDESEVLGAAGFDGPDTGEHPTVEQAYASLAPQPASDPPTAPPVDPREEQPLARFSPPEPARSSESDTSSVPAEADIAPADPVRPAAEVPDVVVEPDGTEPASSPARPLASFFTEDDTDHSRTTESATTTRSESRSAGSHLRSRRRETAGESPEPATRQPIATGKAVQSVGRAAPPTVLEVAPPEEPSYVEDPEERQRYRMRYVATAALLLFLVIVLIWSFDRATDALGSMWDEFIGMLEI